MWVEVVVLVVVKECHKCNSHRLVINNQLNETRESYIIIFLLNSSVYACYNVQHMELLTSTPLSEQLLSRFPSAEQHSDAASSSRAMY